MGLRNFLRKAARREAKHGVGVGVGAITAPQIEQDGEPRHYQFTVSQESLDVLMRGYQQLVQQRAQLQQKTAQVEAAIKQQEGGIQLMQQLLKGQSPPEGTTPPEGAIEGLEVVGPVVADGADEDGGKHE